MAPDGDADVLVVGGGIAGWSAAYFAHRRGRAVTLVDEGVQRASDLPLALVNPLRGHAGRLIDRGVEGMHATFALADALRAEGHAIAGARGLYRPLIDRTQDSRDEAFWRATIGARLAFDWHARAPSTLALVDPVPTLFLRDAGWIVPDGLLAALAAASGATRVAGRVVQVDPVDGVVLADGSTIRARTTLWCGGAWGCAVLDGEANDGAESDARYKPGSLLASATAFIDAPLSFGLYAVPWGTRTIVGPTREDTHSTFPTEAVTDAAIRHLEDRVTRRFGRTIALEATWRGVRLARLSTRANHALRGTPTLTALGSRGFLMAPLCAAEWALSL